MSSLYLRFNARAAEPRRCHFLEHLLARADERGPVEDWRAEAFQCIAPAAEGMPAVAPAAAYAECGAVQAAWLCAATPVHYIAEMANVRLSPDGILTLTPSAAATLAADFNRVWNGAGVRLLATRSAQLFCLFDRALKVRTRDPNEVLGRHIEEYLPTGADSARLRQLISESEMWLFEHGANRIRRESGLPVVNGLWFWGGGVPLASLPTLQGWVGGDDIFFNAFGAGRQAGGENGVIATASTPGSDQWQGIESRWLRPAAAQLRAGRLSRLEISAEQRRFTLTWRNSWRFWRRAKPWWEYCA